MQNSIRGRLYHMLSQLSAKSNYLYVGLTREQRFRTEWRTQVYVLCPLSPCPLDELLASRASE
jgi:hypothetical protein